LVASRNSLQRRIGEKLRRQEFRCDGAAVVGIEASPIHRRRDRLIRVQKIDHGADVEELHADLLVA
jgi:hypothetical protein